VTGLVLLTLSLSLTGAVGASGGSEPILIQVRTELGDILVELYPDQAPLTVSNFLKYVDAGYFDGGRFHRTVRADNQPNDSVKIAVIQGDIDPAHRSDRFPVIPLERTGETGLLHLDGALSMARAGPDTASSSFFICVGDQPELDYGGHRNLDGQGFAAFGRVVEGMDVVMAIHASEADGQTLAPLVEILQVYRRSPVLLICPGVGPGTWGAASRRVSTI